MRVELLIIGNDILISKTQDTNSYWMVKSHTKYGHNVSRITTIGEDVPVIFNTVKSILVNYH
jgi:molybdopterin-biosynthesis enzyme MoeA-like protein